MEDNTATAWIDGIIKDLIHSSTNVSIPQLIHNVREIIYPCNPNLASLLEYRLRTLMDPLERRRKEVQSLHLPLPAGLLQRQAVSGGLTLNLDSATLENINNIPNFSLPEPSAMNPYLNWGTSTPPLPIPAEHQQRSTSRCKTYSAYRSRAPSQTHTQRQSQHTHAITHNNHAI